VSLLTRVVGLFTKPENEWRAIAREEIDIPTLYGRHISILAAIPAAAVLVGLGLAGGRYLGQAGIVTAITAAFVSYAMALAMPFATAVVVALLAPRFKSDGGMIEAMKLVAYASTPYWLLGAFYMFVQLSPVVFVGMLYGLYLFFLGLSPVMGTPLEQRVPFTLIAAITTVVLNTALSWIVGLARLPHYGF
jgi:hypothetical protein